MMDVAVLSSASRSVHPIRWSSLVLRNYLTPSGSARADGFRDQMRNQMKTISRELPPNFFSSGLPVLHVFGPRVTFPQFSSNRNWSRVLGELLPILRETENPQPRMPRRKLTSPCSLQAYRPVRVTKTVIGFDMTGGLCGMWFA